MYIAPAKKPQTQVAVMNFPGLACFSKLLDCSYCDKSRGLKNYESNPDTMPKSISSGISKKLSKPRTRKLGSLQEAEEAQEARERAQSERAKSAWKRIARQASMGNNSADLSEPAGNAGLRKAADALIKAAKRREEQRGVAPSSSLPPPLLTSRSSFSKGGKSSDSQFSLTTEPSETLPDMQAEILEGGGFASPSLSFWKGDSLPSTETLTVLSTHSNLRDISPGSTSPRSTSTLPRSPRGSPRLKITIESPVISSPRPSALTLEASDSFQELPDPDDSTSPDRPLEPSLSLDPRALGASGRMSRNSMDSPRLSQSQALLAKLWGPTSPSNSGVLQSVNSMPLEGTSSSVQRRMGGYSSPRANSPRRVSRSPSRERNDFSTLKQDAYSILMQQNESRIKQEKSRRGSVESLSSLDTSG